MVVNKKRNIRLKNRTKYFDAETSKSHVIFSSPDSYQSRQSKIEGYETRLYWQFRYCQDYDGQTFFYTLTYTDARIPKHYGINCFDYEDLRYLFIGGFNKMLLRKYGTKMKYFVGAELGDGKGQRGMHNNPHYHILFFLENAFDDRFPYVKISPKDFRHLVRLYWQGFDEDEDKKNHIFHDYRKAKYGIAREGENDGLVTDFRACMYCAKYVCKDVKLKMHESEVERRARYVLVRQYKGSEECYCAYFRSRIYSLFNTPLNSKHTEWCFNDIQLLDELLPGEPGLARWHQFFPGDTKLEFYAPYVSAIIRRYGLWEDYSDFVDEFVEPKVKEKVAEFRNRFSNKCRVSQGVGDYALKFVGDKLNPTFQVPDKKQGFKYRPMSMYYYRKLFCDVLHTGVVGDNGVEKTMYVLNEDGVRYKVAHLDDRVCKMAAEAKNNLRLISENPELFEKMKASDINVFVAMSFDTLCKELVQIRKDGIDIFERYAQYKLVYEDRFFKVPSLGSDCDCNFPAIDVRGDYARFLIPSVYSVSRSDLRLDAFLDGDNQDYLPYSQHPYFLRYLGVLHVLDMCADYFFVQMDDKAQKDAEEIAKIRRFHNQSMLKEFYSRFGL